MEYFRKRGLFSSSSPTPTAKSQPLQPKLSCDKTPPSHPEAWENVNAFSTSPVSLPASADGHDADFVSLHDSSTEDSPYLFHGIQQEVALGRHIHEDARHALSTASSGARNRQGRGRRMTEQIKVIGTDDLQREQDVNMEAFYLKEENDKLKTIILQHVKQLEESIRQQSQYQTDVDRLKEERHAVEQVSKEEIERLKSMLQQQARQIEAVSADRDRVRRDRDTVVASFTAENDKLKSMQAKQAEEMKGRLEEMNSDRARTHSELQKSRKNLEKLADELERSITQSDGLHKDLTSVKDALHSANLENKDLRAKANQALDLQRHFEAQTRDLKTARDESSALRKEYDQMIALLDVRTLELKGAQTFLTTADTFSGTEVLNTLQRLNAEVLQNTAFMAESMIESYMSEKGVPKTEEQIAGAKRASGVIGRTIIHFLGTKKHTEDPVLVQIAFQAYFAHVLQWITKAWMIGGDESQNRFIDGIYEKVRETEAQAISGRWRALTHANLPRVQRDDIQLISLTTSKTLSGLADILLAAGCNTTQSQLFGALSAKFSDKISFLVSQAIRVNKIVGEDVTSGDLEVMLIPPATPFDQSSMDDVYNEGVPPRSGAGKPRVLCTTDLGLRKRTRVAMTGEKEKQWVITALLKPKVALESIVDIMDE